MVGYGIGNRPTNIGVLAHRAGTDTRKGVINPGCYKTMNDSRGNQS